MCAGVNSDNRPDSGANADTNEDEAILSDGETSLLDKDDREGFEYCTTQTGQNLVNRITGNKYSQPYRTP
jgi:hypothetical protein